MMAAARRLAAILAADVAGYSRLIGADEDGIIPPVRTYVVARWTGQGHDRQRTPDYHVRSEADSVLDSASATTSRVDADELGGVMTEKLAGLLAESTTEEHALRPVRRRRLDS
jgi:hypothetical protein